MISARARQAAVAVVLCIAIAVLLRSFHPHYPLGKWLFWRYLAVWTLTALFALACTSAGFATLRYLLPKGSLRISETIVFGFGVGVVEFFVAMFVAGLVGLYGGVFFFLLPVILIAAGARPGFRYARRLWRGLRRARRHPTAIPYWTYPVAGLGIIALAMVALPVLTPENAAFDSRWQHLGIAEHYASAKRIERFPEGWYVGTSPHLAAVVYTWAYLMPFSMMFDRIELSAHIELVCLVFSLVGIGALARRLVPGARMRVAWAMRFAFPAIFLYDASLVIGADHIAALFAAPIFLGFLRAWRSLETRWMIVTGALIAGALMTKYTGALLLVGFPLMALGVRFTWLGIERLRKRAPAARPLLGMAAFAATGIVLTAPHWLKNWVWYGNPFYPVASRWFSPHPWTADAAARFDGFVKQELWQPPMTLAGLWDSLKVLVTFSFVPNDWPQFHGSVPVFGSLFTLGILCLPFVRPHRRLLALYAASEVGIFAWYWLHHQDRYLQAAMPWFAAATAAVMALAWRTGIIPRILFGVLVALQVAWGGDIYFWSAHTMIDSPLKSVQALFAASQKREYDKRLKPFSPYYEAGTALARTDRVLVHDSRPRAGLRTRALSDAPGNQGGISYGLLESPARVHELLSSMGVTHLMWDTGRSKGADSIAGELVFHHFAQTYSTDRQSFGHLTLARMPAAAPTDAWVDRVLFFPCARERGGIYHLADLRTPDYVPNVRPPEPFERAPTDSGAVDAWLDGAGFAVVEQRCAANLPGDLNRAFSKAASSKRYDFWIHKR